MDVARLIPGCFGSSDLIFAGHPSDAERAFKLLADCRANSIGWGEVKRAAEGFLRHNGAGTTHIDKQLTDMEASMARWLLD